MGVVAWGLGVPGVQRGLWCWGRGEPGPTGDVGGGAGRGAGGGVGAREWVGGAGSRGEVQALRRCCPRTSPAPSSTCWSSPRPVARAVTAPHPVCASGRASTSAAEGGAARPRPAQAQFPIKPLFPQGSGVPGRGVGGRGRRGVAAPAQCARGLRGGGGISCRGMSGPGGPGPGGGKLDINRAGVAELEGALSGIGRRRARGIVRKREVRVGGGGPAPLLSGRAWAGGRRGPGPGGREGAAAEAGGDSARRGAGRLGRAAAAGKRVRRCRTKPPPPPRGRPGLRGPAPGQPTAPLARRSWGAGSAGFLRCPQPRPGGAAPQGEGRRWNRGRGRLCRLAVCRARPAGSRGVGQPPGAGRVSGPRGQSSSLAQAGRPGSAVPLCLG